MTERKVAQSKAVDTDLSKATFPAHKLDWPQVESAVRNNLAVFRAQSIACVESYLRRLDLTNSYNPVDGRALAAKVNGLLDSWGLRLSLSDGRPACLSFITSGNGGPGYFFLRCKGQPLEVLTDRQLSDVRVIEAEGRKRRTSKLQGT